MPKIAIVNTNAKEVKMAVHEVNRLKVVTTRNAESLARKEDVIALSGGIDLCNGGRDGGGRD
jgi:hypothetical protein